jgi:hypothetical protein
LTLSEEGRGLPLAQEPVATPCTDRSGENASWHRITGTVKISLGAGRTSFFHGAALQLIVIAPVTRLTTYPLTGGVACYALQLIVITPVTRLTAYPLTRSVACYTLQLIVIASVTGLTADPLTRFAKLHIVCSQSRSTRETQAQHKSTRQDTDDFRNR